jgi:hypothetical protein
LLIAALPAADILRFLFFRPLAESAARVLPSALAAAVIALNCRSRLAFAFVILRASFCNAASSFIPILPATSYAKCSKKKSPSAWFFVGIDRKKYKSLKLMYNDSSIEKQEILLLRQPYLRETVDGPKPDAP